MLSDKLPSDTETSSPKSSETRFLPAYTAGLTADALTITQPIVSHTTSSFENVRSILIEGIKLQSHPYNLMDGETFYVAEKGYSIQEVEGQYTMTFRVTKDTKILDATQQPWVAMKTKEIMEVAQSKGYDAVKYEGSFRTGRHFSYNLAIVNPECIVPTAAYKSPVDTVRNSAISLPWVKGIQTIGLVGTGYSLVQAGIQIKESSEPAKEAAIQTGLFGAAVLGGKAAMRLSIGPCTMVGELFPPAAHITVPACIALSGIGGGILSASALQSGLTSKTSVIPRAEASEVPEEKLQNTGWGKLLTDSHFPNSPLDNDEPNSAVMHLPAGCENLSFDSRQKEKAPKPKLVAERKDSEAINERLIALKSKVDNRVVLAQTSLSQKAINTENLNDWALNLAVSANMAHDAGILAEALHHHHWAREFNIVGSGLGRISSGLSILSMPTISPLMMIGSYLSIGAGIAILFSSRRNKKDNGLAEAINAIMGSLQHLGRMAEQILKNQGTMQATLQVTVRMVQDIETRLKQQYSQTQATQNFIATKDIQDALISIQGDLDGTNAIAQSKEDFAKNLTTLEHWLKRHLYSPAINYLASGPTTPNLAIEMLSSVQDPWMIIGFIVSQIQSHLGHSVPDKFLLLPPFALYVQVAQVFLQGMAKAKLPSDDKGLHICNSIQNQIGIYLEFIDFLKSSPHIWEAMFSLYEHKRNMLGRVICELGIANTNISLNEQVTQDIKRTQLIDALDSMESIRLLLQVMEYYAGFRADDAISQKINALESKVDILKLKGSELHLPRSSYHAAIDSKDTKAVVLALRAGVDATSTYAYGTPLNHICHALYSTWGNSGLNQQYALDLIYDIAKCSSVEADKTRVLNFTHMGAIPPSGFDTWWSTNTASRLTLNNGDYAAMLLQIAMGYSPDWMWANTQNSNAVMGNLPAWVASGSYTSIETMMIVSSTKDKNGVLNAEKLTKAFAYYQAVDRGQLRLAQELSTESIDMDCLFWLTCLLGRWQIFKSLPLPVGFDFAKTLGDFQFYHEGHYQFSGCPGHNGMYTTQICSGPVHSTKSSTTTPLMVAAEHGRTEVIEALISIHQQGCDIGLTKVFLDGSTVATKAFSRGFFDIAKRLNDLGARLSEADKTTLATKNLQNGPLSYSTKYEMFELKASLDKKTSDAEAILHDLSTLVTESQTVFEEFPKPKTAESKDEEIEALKAQLRESNENTKRLATAVEALLKGGFGTFSQKSSTSSFSNPDTLSPQ